MLGDLLLTPHLWGVCNESRPIPSVILAREIYLQVFWEFLAGRVTGEACTEQMTSGPTEEEIARSARGGVRRRDSQTKDTGIARSAATVRPLRPTRSAGDARYSARSGPEESLSVARATDTV